MVLQTTIIIALQPFLAPLPALHFLTPAPAPFLDLPTPLLLTTLVWVETFNNRNMVSMHAKQTK